MDSHFSRSRLLILSINTENIFYFFLQKFSSNYNKKSIKNRYEMIIIDLMI